MPYDIFHPFPRLPTELRLKIWSHTLPEEKVVEITWNDEHSQWGAIRASAHPTYLPGLASREARENYLMNWTRFCPYHSADLKSLAQYPVCYINPNIDTLYLSAGTKEHEEYFEETESYQGMSQLPCLNEIRRLGCEIIEWSMMCDQNDGFDCCSSLSELEVFHIFPKLDVFMIVDYDMDWEWFEKRHVQRRVGTIDLVEQTKEHIESRNEMWPKMVKRLDSLRKLKQYEGRVPRVEVKEIMRGGERMNYNSIYWS
jgi:hypothetical protein